MIRFPRPLRPGDRIGVTAPSSGVGPRFAGRLERNLAWLRERGYDVVVGECMAADRVVSAPAADRAAELTAMLTDPAIAAVVPPWGGELAVDLLDLLDWDALAAAEPTWAVGFSDTSTWMLPLTLRLGWATLHGTNLMDTLFAPPPGLLHWTEVAASTTPVTQTSPGRHATAWPAPDATGFDLDATGTWSVLGGGEVDVTGRLVGGCLETIGALTGTPFGDVPSFAPGEGTIVFLDIAESGAYDVCRALHGLRLAGWFDPAVAVLVSRTDAPDSPMMTQRGAVRDALGRLGVPVVLDVECGHVPPYLPLVTGALARVVVDDRRREITQSLE